MPPNARDDTLSKEKGSTLKIINNITHTLLAALFLSTAAHVRSDEIWPPVSNGVSSTLISGFVGTAGILGLDPRPENDNFADALPLTGIREAVYTSNVGATSEAGEPAYYDSPAGSSIWYSWTTPATGRAQITLRFPSLSVRNPAVSASIPDLSLESIFVLGGGFNAQAYSNAFSVLTNVYGVTVVVDSGYTDSAVFIGEDAFQNGPNSYYGHILAVYSGDNLNNLTLVGRADTVNFHAIAGQKYWISFAGINGYAQPGGFWVVQTPPPANDNFAEALLVQNASVATLEGNLSSASREGGEPNLGPLYSGGSVWFHWKAGTYGPAGLTNTGAIFPMAVYRGDTLTNLTLLNKSTNGTAAFYAEDSQDYWIALYRGTQTEDEFSLQLTGPTYRSFSVSMAELMPPGYFPYFHGLRGQTLLVYAKTATGRQCVEIEPIKDGQAVLLRRPDSIDGDLQIVTIDSVLPAPHVQFVRSGGASLVPVVRGYPGQSCEISYSSDLETWRLSRSLTLTTRSARMNNPSVAGQAALFYRVLQRFPPLEMAVIPPR